MWVMEPEELRTAMAERALNQRQLAKALCISEAAVSLWLSGDNPIPGWVTVALRAVRKKRTA